MSEEQRQRAQEESDLLVPDGVKSFVTTLFNHLLVPDDKALEGESILAFLLHRADTCATPWCDLLQR